MPDTIESFVAKLQADGVQAGQKQADTLRAQAQADADRVVAEAREKAVQIVQAAETQARDALTRARGEMQLAARDVVLRLRQVLGNVLAAVLTRSASETLNDPQFLRTLLHELVLKYAHADIEGVSTMEIHVNEEQRHRLSEWAISEIHQKTGGKLALDLKDELKTAGFEYNVSGATVEVTTESVAEMLGRLVSPALRELIDQAVGKQA